MTKSQKFTLLLISGLIILSTIGYYILKEIRVIMRERAQAEMAQQGFRGVKEIIGKFKEPVNQ